VKVSELIDRLQELPPDWHILATKSGNSLEFHDPATGWFDSGHRYGWLLFDDGQIKLRTRR
jgi:hypothetical protein